MHIPFLIAMPALNEGNSIERVITEIREALGSEITVLVVDDGSHDDTAEIARRSGAHLISHEKTLGLGQSFRDILHFALNHQTDLLVTIDADGQFDPGDIPRLIQPIQEGRADFVTGRRFSGADSPRPTNMSRVKYFGNLCMSWLVSTITQREIMDASCGFRAYSREALLQLNLHSSFTYTQESFLDLATKNIRIEQVVVSVEYRQGRQSRVVRSILHYAVRTSATILRSVRDHRPLFVFGTPAITLCLFGISAGLFVLIRYLYVGSFSPYIFVGMIGAYLFSLGLVIGIVGIASDMLRPIRRNQEEMLYFLKKQQYYGPEAHALDTPVTREIV